MQKQKKFLSTKTLVACALLAAMNVVLARLMGFMPNESMRFSIEAVPTFLAGLLFGPLAGAMVGFVGDFVGCLFSPYGYNPIYCIPPILYGLCGGLFQGFLRKKMSLPRTILAFIPPVVLGSLLWQSAVLSFLQFDGSFWAGYLYFLSTRALQFAITLAADSTVLFLLFKSGIFEHIGLWQPLKSERKSK